ncbi:AMP-binding protein [Amycolatopsis sp. VS8301801F10]|uniref:AMP-binding protein n=1 Tax=Amycolatopsis sp. VS8301801F10 TaxID=2652442 RepID=UPI0038FCDD4C
MTGLTEDVLALAETRPRAGALRWRGADVSYAELAGLVRQAQAELAAQPGEGPVAVVAPKSPETVAFVLACVLARRAVLLPSPDLGRTALAELVERAGCEHVAEGGASGIELRATETPAARSDDVRFLLTTSGSTGTPKIVPLAEEPTDRFMHWAVEQFGLGPGVDVLNYAPLNFDLCLLDVWATLRAGGRATLVEADHAVNPRHLVELLHAEPHVVQAVPMFFRIVADAVRSSGTQFPSVRHVVLTGDHTPRPLRAELPKMFPSARFHNVYGCTETNDSFLHSFDGHEADAHEVLPLGRPLPGVRARIVADDGTELTGAGTGELSVSTPFQTRGYLGEDNARFVTGPDGVPYFRSGDLVSRTEDGVLTLAGRTDFQVKVRGVRVGLEDVERVIAEHPETAEVGVVALPDPQAGQRLHAVVRRRSARLTGLGLRQHCAQRLVRAAIPSVIQIVDTALPLTSTGKVDRKRIRKELLAGES